MTEDISKYPQSMPCQYIGFPQRLSVRCNDVDGFTTYGELLRFHKTEELRGFLGPHSPLVFGKRPFIPRVCYEYTDTVREIHIEFFGFGTFVPSNGPFYGLKFTRGVMIWFAGSPKGQFLKEMTIPVPIPSMFTIGFESTGTEGLIVVGSGTKWFMPDGEWVERIFEYRLDGRVFSTFDELQEYMEQKKHVASSGIGVVLALAWGGALLHASPYDLSSLDYRGHKFSNGSYGYDLNGEYSGDE